jgi:hypothetical protein
VTFFDPESAPILRNLFQVDSVGDSRAFPDPKEGLGRVGTWFFLMMSDLLARAHALSHERHGAIASRLDKARLAEDEAFRRLSEASDDWHEALGAWLRAVRALQREKWLARVF